MVMKCTCVLTGVSWVDAAWTYATNKVCGDEQGLAAGMKCRSVLCVSLGDMAGQRAALRFGIHFQAGV